MRGTREITFFSLLVVAILLVQSAGAGPFDTLPYFGCSDIFGTGNASIAQVWDGVNARASGIDNCTIQPCSEPVCWTLTGSPVQSPHFLFADVVDSDEQTGLLRFAADGRAAFEQRPAVWSECMHDGRLTYVGAGNGIACIVSHDWSLDF